MSIISEDARRYYTSWQESLREADVARTTPDVDEDWIASRMGRMCERVWRHDETLEWFLYKSFCISIIAVALVTISWLCMLAEPEFNKDEWGTFGYHLFFNPLWAVALLMITLVVRRGTSTMIRAYLKRADKAVPTRYDKAIQQAQYRRGWFLDMLHADLEKNGFAILSQDRNNAAFVTTDGVLTVIHDPDSGVDLLLNGSPLLSGYSHLVKDENTRTATSLTGRKVPLREPINLAFLRGRRKTNA